MRGAREGAFLMVPASTLRVKIKKTVSKNGGGFCTKGKMLTSMCIYIYIYKERERERECVCVCVYIYIYIYVYIRHASGEKRMF